MKLGEDVLLEIVDIVRDGIVSGTDVSEKLRQLDLATSESNGSVYASSVLKLSNEYLSSKGRVV